MIFSASAAPRVTACPPSVALPQVSTVRPGMRLGAAVHAYLEALNRGTSRDAALAAIPDSVVDELIVHGPAEACREHIARYVDNGVTTPALALLPFGTDPQTAYRALAPA